MDNIEQQVKKVVAEQLSINEADIKNESAFISDLGADSFNESRTELLNASCGCYRIGHG